MSKAQVIRIALQKRDSEIFRTESGDYLSATDIERIIDAVVDQLHPIKTYSRTDDVPPAKMELSADQLADIENLRAEGGIVSPVLRIDGCLTRDDIVIRQPWRQTKQLCSCEMKLIEQSPHVEDGIAHRSPSNCVPADENGNPIEDQGYYQVGGVYKPWPGYIDADGNYHKVTADSEEITSRKLMEATQKFRDWNSYQEDPEQKKPSLGRRLMNWIQVK